MYSIPNYIQIFHLLNVYLITNVHVIISFPVLLKSVNFSFFYVFLAKSAYFKKPVLRQKLRAHKKWNFLEDYEDILNE